MATEKNRNGRSTIDIMFVSFQFILKIISCKAEERRHLHAENVIK